MSASLLNVDLYSRSGTYVHELHYLVSTRTVLRKPSSAMNAFARSAPLGSTRSAMRTGLILSSIVGIVLFAGGRIGEMMFRLGVAVYAEPRREANPVRS